jgi:hypothetical protein
MKFPDLDIADVLVANFQELIRPAIPKINTLLTAKEVDVCKAGLATLLKLLEQSNLWHFQT